MGIIIKKRVSLDFLGDENKDDYLVFKSIPAKDLPDILDESEKAKDNTKQIIPFFIKVLRGYFIEGTFSNSAVVKEDIDELDAESIIHCFKILTGQALDPKANGPSTPPSGAEDQPPPN